LWQKLSSTILSVNLCVAFKVLINNKFFSASLHITNFPFPVIGPTGQPQTRNKQKDNNRQFLYNAQQNISSTVLSLFK